MSYFDEENQRLFKQLVVILREELSDIAYMLANINDNLTDINKGIAELTGKKEIRQ